MISYDLIGNEGYEDYKVLIDYIKLFPSATRVLKSQWLIETAKTPAIIRDEISRYIDSDDKILVLDITNSSWASLRISSDAASFLKK